jgi:radical SAM/Cys-rich protein
MSAFARAVHHSDPSALRAASIDTLMVNVGLRCDQACAHCHQSCSPQRTEIMSTGVMDLVVSVADDVRPRLVDITGGAPELNPDIRHLLARLRESGHSVRLRTNLTALLTPEAEGLIAMLADLEISVLASLPGITDDEFAAEREHVFTQALAALQRLSDAGYGRDRGLRLDLAVNRRADEPALSESAIEKRFRSELTGRLGIPFDDVVVITNVPVGRFRERLEREHSLDAYLVGLRDSFNPDTLPHLACRTCIDIAWDGTLWDCDFNLGRGIPLAEGVPRHVSQFDAAVLQSRPLRFAEHCFACTASAGSG